nr:MAG TPA: hypothetical protein [Caudoviricetes sp.]
MKSKYRLNWLAPSAKYYFIEACFCQSEHRNY